VERGRGQAGPFGPYQPVSPYTVFLTPFVQALVAFSVFWVSAFDQNGVPVNTINYMELEPKEAARTLHALQVS
jgi:hypothetical protein